MAPLPPATPGAQTYPRVVEGDPVLDPVAEPLKAQAGKVIEVVDHADVLPASVLLLQHLRNEKRSFSLAGPSGSGVLSNCNPFAEPHNRERLELDIFSANQSKQHEMLHLLMAHNMNCHIFQPAAQT